MRRLVIIAALVVLSLISTASTAEVPGGQQLLTQMLEHGQVRSLEGRGNNLGNPEWGAAGTAYLRAARPNYADNVGSIRSGPPARYVSNRIFNDVGQALVSENGVSQWGWAWGQFVDHDVGLANKAPGESAAISFSGLDPLESFTNDFGKIEFSRTPAAPGTGTGLPREQINTISSYLDASNVYGVTTARLDWLRDGRGGGDPEMGPFLMLSADGYLPRVGIRGDPVSAPAMDRMGRLIGRPDEAVVAGDVRANESIALTAIHTLMAQEHNRIVAALPSSLTAESRFQIARRVVSAEVQFITYTEFLPALGVELDRYPGYSSGTNPGLANEFAVVGYRSHSMVVGTFKPVLLSNTYSDEQLAGFEQQGIAIEALGGGQIRLEIPLTAAFGNPDLLRDVGLGPVLQSLGRERQSRNDEMIDDSLRSVLFQAPKRNAPNPTRCGQSVIDPNCFSGVVDLGAIDVERGRDHGMPTYNQLRRAYGLPVKRSFTDITGERGDQLRGPAIGPGNPIDDPSILDFVSLRGRNGLALPSGTSAAREQAVTGVRRTTLAARLKAIYGDVDEVDAFVGMVSEPHVPGSEFGELQLAIWRRQFEAVRDGDRFFYLNDPVLNVIHREFGISFRHTLSELIMLNSGVVVQPDVFRADE